MYFVKIAFIAQHINKSFKLPGGLYTTEKISSEKVRLYQQIILNAKWNRRYRVETFAGATNPRSSRNGYELKKIF